MSDDEDHDICYKQPENGEELAQCYEALENCPVEAIGDGGPKDRGHEPPSAPRARLGSAWAGLGVIPQKSVQCP